MADVTGTNKIKLENLPDKTPVRNFDGGRQKLPKQMLIGALVIVAAGILSGYVLSSSFSKSGRPMLPAQGGISTSGKSVGSSDTKTFPDSAEGQLEAGGIDGEGTHKLIRPGGDSQTVYLTSSVLDLNQFVGKKVKVWGQTFSAKKAGWLMDVGRVETL